jgi:hypothetical protein
MKRQGAIVPPVGAGAGAAGAGAAPKVNPPVMHIATKRNGSEIHKQTVNLLLVIAYKQKRALHSTAWRMQQTCLI